MDEFLDGAVEGNIRLLPDLLRGLNREEKVLRGQLVTDSSVGGNEWLEVVSDVHTTISSLQSLHTKLDSLSLQVQGTGLSGQPWQEAGLVAEGVAKLVEQVEELEQLQCYLTWICHISKLSNQIEGHVTGKTEVEALNPYMELCEVCLALQPSGCVHLKEWAVAVQSHWKQVLNECLSSLFSPLLATLHWPQTGPPLPTQALDVWDNHSQQFSQLFGALMKMDDRVPPKSTAPQSPAPQSTAPTPQAEVGRWEDPLPLPLELMVKPLKKRFRYHFMEDRKTNSLEKPEWYLTQVSSWLCDHTPILDQRIQPVLDSLEGYQHVSAKVEFCRGLLREVVNKLEVDLRDITSHDSLMAHLVDELLFFERELRLSVWADNSSGAANLTVLSVLLESVAFDKWRNLEKACAVERLKELTSNEFAWSQAYGDMEGVDINKVPCCTEDLMLLIKGITERYKYLPSPHHQLLFLELQVDLLLEFHQDLSDSASQTHPLHPQFAAYFNASQYIATILRLWGEEKFFLELLYYSKGTPHSDDAPHSCHVTGAKRLSVPVETLQQLRRADKDLRSEEGALFDTSASAFSSLVEEMQGRLVTEMVDKAKVACRKYGEERWHKMVDHRNQICMQVSPGAADLLTFLGEQLLILERLVSTLLFPAFMEKLGQRLDELILTDVILSSNFTEGGVEQLDFDLKHYLIPIVARHCDDIISKQLFEKSLEGVAMLSLLPGSAQLLDDVLSLACNSASDENIGEAVRALGDTGVHALSPSQAREILKHKMYITS